MTPPISGTSNAAPPPTSISRLARFIAGTEATTGGGAATMVRDALIDTLGCILIGADEQASVKARQALRLRTGTAPVYGTSATAEPATAALLNATAAHALEFDDWEVPGNTHPSAVLFPALLAAAHGTTVSGAAIADSYVMGFEVIARLGNAFNYDHYERGWHATATFGAIGAAAAVARLWRLDAGAVADALSLAVSRAGGLTTQFGSDAKPLHAGFAAETGLTAAVLARAGVGGHAGVLDGPKGYGALTARHDPDRIAAALGSLGTNLSIETHGLVFKPYPSCGYTHRIVDAARSIGVRERVDPERVARIDLHLPDFHAAVAPFGHPQDAREARFSLPFCAAVALLDGDLGATAFMSAVWNRPDVTVLMDRTTVHPFIPLDPQTNYDPRQPDRVVVTLSDGHCIEETVVYPLGSPQRPLSSAAILEKFKNNAAARPHTRAMVDGLNTWMDADDLLGVLDDWRGAP